MITFYVALGGNLGNVPETFAQVLRTLAGSEKVTRVSSIYRTIPLRGPGVPHQEYYFNAAAEVVSDKDPHEFLRLLMNLETELGLDRSKKVFWGPRIIDLDIISASELRVETEDLVIPHPRYAERDFVLIPLQEICPDWTCPRTGVSVAGLLSKLAKHNLTVLEKFSSLEHPGHLKLP